MRGRSLLCVVALLAAAAAVHAQMFCAQQASSRNTQVECVAALSGYGPCLSANTAAAVDQDARTSTGPVIGPVNNNLRVRVVDPVTDPEVAIHFNNDIPSCTVRFCVLTAALGEVCQITETNICNVAHRNVYSLTGTATAVTVYVDLPMGGSVDIREVWVSTFLQASTPTLLDAMEPTFLTTLACADPVPGEDAVAFTDQCWGVLLADLSSSNGDECALDETWRATNPLGGVSLPFVRTIARDVGTPTLVGAFPSSLNCVTDFLTADEFLDTLTVVDNCYSQAEMTASLVVDGRGFTDITVSVTFAPPCGPPLTIRSATLTLGLGTGNVPALFDGHTAVATAECCELPPLATVPSDTLCVGSSFSLITKECMFGACDPGCNPTMDPCTASVALVYVVDNGLVQFYACTQVTRVDTQGPQFIGPAVLTGECGGAALPDPTATDCSGMPVVTSSDGPSTALCGELPGAESYTRTFTGVDPVGNVAMFSQLRLVEDTLRPMLPAIATGPFPFSCTEASPTPPPSTGATTAPDQCFGAVPIVVEEQRVSGGAADYQLRRTISATDPCGNEDSVTVVFDVTDAEPPVFTPGFAFVSVPCTGASLSSATFSPAATGTTPTATDTCSGSVSVFQSAAQATMPDVAGPLCAFRGEIYRSWTARDGFGNEDTLSQVVRVTDNQPPVLAPLPGPHVIQCDAPFPFPAVSDNCSPPGALSVTNTTLSNGFPVPGCASGDVTVEYEAVDACDPGMRRRGDPFMFPSVYTFTVVDSVGPVVDVSPTYVEALCNADTSTPALGIQAMPTDACSTVSFVTEDDVELPGPCLGRGRIVRTFTATDACGNAGSANAVIQLLNVPPTIAFSGMGFVTVECGADLSPDLSQVTATDPCDNSVAISYYDVPIGPGPSFVRTFTATDTCGTQDTVTQTLNVQDTTPPVFEDRPTSATVECTGSTPNVDFLGTPRATDACGPVGPVTVSSTMELAEVACVPPVRRCWEVDDQAENTATRCETVFVVDTTPPVLSVPASVEVPCGGVPTLGESIGAASATDTCDAGPLVVSAMDISDTPGMCGEERTVVRRFSATDECGNEGVALQTIEVVDNTPPVIDISAILDQAFECGVQSIPAPPPLMALDACDGAVPMTATDAVTAGCGDAVVVRRTWTAVDACGNTAKHVQTLQLVDTSAPMLTSTPADVVLECGPGVDPLDLAVTGAVTAADACNAPIAITFADAATGTCSGGEDIVRTWTARDQCTGLTAQHVQAVSVEDNTDPVWRRRLPSRVVECGGSTDPSATGVPNAADATDSCDSSVHITHNTFADEVSTCGGENVFLREWRAADSCDNAAVYTQTIVVRDTRSPVVSPPPSVTVLCSEPTDTAALGSATGADVCSAVGSLAITHADIVLPQCGGTGEIRRVWTALDECGNAGTATQTILVEDGGAPAFSFFPASEVNECGALVEPSVPVASDDCSAAVITVTDTVTPGCGRGAVTVRRWQATDQCGNTVVRRQTITVVDTLPPFVLGVPEGSEMVTCGTDLTPSTEEGAATEPATGSDQCSLTTTVSYTDTRVPFSIEGDCGFETTRRWTAVDECGLSNTAEYTIVELDDAPPVFVSVPADAELECDADTSVAARGAALAADDCGAVVVSHTDNLMGSSCEATLVRTWVANDTCGNTDTYDQTLELEDTQAPEFTYRPPTAALECSVDDLEDPELTGGPALAVDACGPPVETTVEFYQPVFNVTSGTCGGTFVRIWEAYDFCENARTYAQTIVVQDTLAPVITPGPDVEAECGSSPPGFGTPTAVDECYGDVPVTFQDRHFATCAGPATRTVRTWRAEDACGNRGTATQQRRIVDTTPPSFSFEVLDYVQRCNDSLAPPAAYTPDTEDACSATVDLTYDNDVVVEGFCGGKVRRTWTSMDPCGNTQELLQTVTIVDDVAPVFSAAPTTVVRECVPGQTVASALSPARTGVPGAADDCSGEVVPEEADATLVEETECVHVDVERTWSVADDCGNAQTFVQTVSLRDTTPPTVWLTEGSSVALECREERGPEGRAGGVEWTDCSAAGVVGPGDLLDGFGDCDAGVITRNFTVVDACGAATTVMQTITVTDSTPPRATFLPGDRLGLECGMDAWRAVAPSSMDAYTELAVPAADPTVRDACSVASVATSVQDFLPHPTKPCSGSWIVQRRFSAEDACGNAAPVLGVQTIEVVDRQPPELVPPPDRHYECGELVEEEVLVSLSDVCVDVDEVVTTRALSVAEDTACGRVLHVDWTATDPCGNVGQAQQVITVSDTLPPVFSPVPPAEVTLECASPEAVLAEETAPFVTAVDACDGILQVNVTEVVEQQCAATKTITRRWNTVDACGFTNSIQQVVRIIDSTPPRLVPAPSEQRVQCERFVPQATFVTLSSDQLTALGLAVVDECTAAAGGNFTVQYRDEGPPVPVVCEEVEDADEPFSTFADFERAFLRHWIITDECGVVSELQQRLVLTIASVAANPVPAPDVDPDVESPPPAVLPPPPTPAPAQPLEPDDAALMRGQAEVACANAGGVVAQSCEVTPVEAPVDNDEVEEQVVMGGDGQPVASVAIGDLGPTSGPGLRLRIQQSSPDAITTLLGDQAEVVSAIVDVTVVDNGGNEVPFRGRSTLCFVISTDHDESDVCIGYLDEKRRRARCEDECPDDEDTKLEAMVEDDGLYVVCGNVEHYTNFAVLLKGGVDGADGDCSLGNGQWIFGRYEIDLAVVIGMIAVVLFLATFVGLCAHRIPGMRKATLAASGQRKKLRKMRRERDRAIAADNAGVVDE